MAGGLLLFLLRQSCVHFAPDNENTHVAACLTLRNVRTLVPLGCERRHRIAIKELGLWSRQVWKGGEALRSQGFAWKKKGPGPAANKRAAPGPHAKRQAQA